jgi:integral membrane protein (TIGR00529 family)
MLTMTQWPLFLAVLVGGILFGLVGIERGNSFEGSRPGNGQSLTLLLKSIWPIVLVLALSILFDVDLILSLLVTVAALVTFQRLGPRRLWDLAKSMPLGTVPVIFGTMVFRRVLETSSAIEVASEAFAGLGIPVSIIVFSVPMVAGLLTGLAVAAFAIGFPIVFPLCGPDLIGSGYGLLAYAGGFVGLMLSPVHLCLALTRVYFGAGWGGVYRRLVPASALVVITAAIVVWVK